MIKVALDIDDTLCHSCPAFKPMYTHDSYKNKDCSISELENIVISCENKSLCEYLKKFISKGDVNQ
mgnify:CR=1 FL=1|jgi:hypothetical protein